MTFDDTVVYNYISTPTDNITGRWLEDLQTVRRIQCISVELCLCVACKDRMIIMQFTVALNQVKNNF